jgi:uncharacterized membrane protein
MTKHLRNLDAVLRIRRHQPTRVEGFVDSALAFAVTLLVISVGHLPTSVPEVLQALRGLPTFAVCFLLIARIWSAHRYWSRHYDIEDATAVSLSLLLVFLVLIYVYPLRMLFSLAFYSMSGGWLAEHPVVIQDTDELRAAYVVFGIGLAAIALVFALLFRHALRCGDTIGLDAAERVITRMRIAAWGCTGAVALLSMLLAEMLPFESDNPRLYSLPGCAYWLLFLTRPLLRRYVARHLAALPPVDTPT